MPDMPEPVWLFGYGSIIWKTGFDFDDRSLGFIRHYARRFWQASIDHRGTPERPGRVVTLAHAAGEKCWGMAYRIPGELLHDTLAALDRREVGGYERYPVTIELQSGLTVRGLTYQAPPDNPHFLGESDLGDMAEQIRTSIGPSGSNTEYILELHQALAKEGIHDEHVKTLAELVQTSEGQL